MSYYILLFRQKLMNLTTSIRSLIGKTDIWTEHLHKEWIELFGSPNVFVYPNTPFSAMTKLLPSNLIFEVQELQVFFVLHFHLCDVNGKF